MNEIEKAIKAIKIAIAEVEWNYPLDYAIAFETAIEALQEKLEREKGCATCNKSNLFIKQHKFPYCPMCGRKLGENK